MKRVSFKVAKAIKEAGYPQNQNWNFETLVVTDSDYVTQFLNINSEECYSCPSYMEVWLWLWREKDIKIDIDYCINKCAIFDITQEVIYSRTFDDPEEAIVTAIEYLVNNKLLK